MTSKNNIEALIRIILLPILCSVEGLHSRMENSAQVKKDTIPIKYTGMNRIELSIPVSYSLFRFILFRQKRYKYKLKKGLLKKKDKLYLIVERAKDGWQITYYFVNDNPESKNKLLLLWSELY